MPQPLGIANRIWTSLSASLPIVILFLRVPLDLYMRHATALKLPSVSVAYCALVGLILVLAVIAVAALTRRDRRTSATRLALLGIILLACHFLQPTAWNLNAPTFLLTGSWLSIGVELLFLIVLVSVWVRLPQEWRVTIGATLTLGATVASAAMFWRIDDNFRPRHPIVAHPVVNRPNVYHFVFDGFATPAFPPTIAGRLKSDFPGFTYYRRNRANYMATDASLPSMLSGDFFAGGDFEAFQRRARQGGIRKALADHGYSVATYTPDRNRFWNFDTANYITTNQDLARADFDQSGAISLLQMSFVTSAPSLLRRPLLLLSGFMIPKSAYRNYKQFSVGLISRFLSDEVKRPDQGQYVYVHILLPHPPYRYDRNCRPARDRASYQSQAFCTTILMTKVVKRLRALGHLKGSLVIFGSDHGFDRARSGLDSGREDLPDSVVRTIIDSGEQFSPQEIMERSQALLLVKMPNATPAPLHISDAPTQLIDIPATIARATGLDLPVGRGVAVNTLNNTRKRTWHFFTGLEKTGGLFRPKHGSAGLAHIARLSDGKWRIYPSVPVSLLVRPLSNAGPRAENSTEYN